MVWFSYFFVGYIHTLDVGEGFSGDLFLMFPEKKLVDLSVTSNPQDSHATVQLLNGNKRTSRDFR